LAVANNFRGQEHSSPPSYAVDVTIASSPLPLNACYM
jgi:hypothetical protein